MNIRSSGALSEQWEQWNPSTHANPNPSVRECPDGWAVYSERPNRTTQYNGRGAVSAHSASVLGVPNYGTVHICGDQSGRDQTSLRSTPLTFKTSFLATSQCGGEMKWINGSIRTTCVMRMLRSPYGDLRRYRTVPPSVANRPNTFAILYMILRFFSAYNHRVCGRIPIIYSVSSVL